jgi:hypothetical protein
MQAVEQYLDPVEVAQVLHEGLAVLACDRSIDLDDLAQRVQTRQQFLPELTGRAG